MRPANLIKAASRRDSNYLSNNAMKSTANSLGLISNVTGFEIVELWTSCGDEGVRCTYVHATDIMLNRYPHIKNGHHPKRDISEHTISPKLCELVAKEQAEDGKICHWVSLAEDDERKTLYPGHPLVVKTEMSYRLEADTGGVNVYIVALSPRIIEFKQATVTFLSGLAYAVYIAAFNSEDEVHQDEGDHEDKELDDKEFVPVHPIHNDNSPRGSPRGSVNNLQELGGGSRSSSAQGRSRSGTGEGGVEGEKGTGEANGASDGATGFGVFGKAAVLASDGSGHSSGAGSGTGSGHSGAHPLEDSKASQQQSHVEGKGSDHAQNKHDSHHNRHSQHSQDYDPNEAADQYFDPNRLHEKDAECPHLTAPTWEPSAVYCYPVADIPVKYQVPDNLTFDDFSDVQHLADGSNSNVFICRFNGQKVVIKIIKEEVHDNPIAVHEFDQEYGMLARMDNPHIIKVLGAGQIPRRFIVLEYLSGGSLNDILLQNQNQQSSITNMLFRKPSFTYDNLLLKARDMAEAFDYLHFRCHPGATIIHRDLKPDNIGFTSDGTLKLFDFGLVTCVKARKHAKDTYDMTGYTGSLRYMAPEVALRERYTEKVDVYSFGIMLWQMAKDRMPFKGMGKQEFFQDIVKGGVRPKLDKTWPAGFNDLLSRCWKRNPEERPSFAMIIIDLNKLISALGSKKAPPRRGKPIMKRAATDPSGGKLEPVQSSWF